VTRHAPKRMDTPPVTTRTIHAVTAAAATAAAREAALATLWREAPDGSGSTTTGLVLRLS
jgi:hypothetical protein